MIYISSSVFSKDKIKDVVLELVQFGFLNIELSGGTKFDLIDWIFTNYPDKVFEIHVSENNGNRDSHEISEVDSWQIELLGKNEC